MGSSPGTQPSPVATGTDDLLTRARTEALVAGGPWAQIGARLG